MVSKKNQYLRRQHLCQQLPHYGLRKLAVGGVASVLLGVTFFIGANTVTVHADTVNDQETTAAVKTDASVVLPKTSENQSNDQADTSAVASPQAEAAQSTYHDDNVTSNLDRTDYNPRDGQAVNLKVKYVTKAGDSYTINIPKGAYNVSAVNLSGGIGQTTQQKNDDGSVTITNTFTATGTYNQSITLTPLTTGNILTSTQLYDGGTTLKQIDLLKNHQRLGQVTFNQTITPTIDPKFNRTNPDPQVVGKLTNNVDYQWTLKLNETSGLNASTFPNTGASANIDHGTTVTIPVPAGFVLNATESDQNSKYWKASQTGGAGADITFTSLSGDWQKSNAPIVLVGHFTTALTDQDQVLTANGPIKVVQEIGNGQSITAMLTPFSETLMKSSDNDNHGSAIIGDVAGAYGGTEYPSGKIPLVNNQKEIKLWSYSFGNISAWSLQNVHVNATVPDGMQVTTVQLPAAITSGNVTYTLHMYVDADHPDETVTGKFDLSKQRTIDLTKISGALRSLDLKFDQLAAGQQTGYVTWYQRSAGLRLMGYLNTHYDNGDAVKVGDELTSDLKIAVDGESTTLQESATQQVIAKPTKPAKFWAFGQQTDKTTGKSGGFLMTQYGVNVNNDDLVDPVFYYVLPSNATFDESNRLNQFNPYGTKGYKPKVTQFKAADGRTVVKVDYTGSGMNWINSSMSADTLYLLNKPDVTNSSSNYKIFVVLPNGMKAQASNSTADFSTVSQSDLQYVESNQSAYQIGSGNWITQIVEGAQIVEQSQGNKNVDLVVSGESDNHGSDKMTYTGSVVNGTNTDLNNVVYVLNLPDTQDGQSGFNFQLAGPVKVINATSNQVMGTATVRYSTSRGTLTKDNTPTGGNFTDYDANTVNQVRSILVSIPKLAVGESVRVIMDGIDPTLATDVGRTGYLSSGVYTADDKLKPFIVMPNDSVAARIKVTGTIAQNATLTFHDDTTGQGLKDVLAAHGKAGELTATGEGGSAIEFTNAADLVKTLKDLHYQFASVSGIGSNGATDFAKVTYGNYDEDTATTQNFVLHFVHQTTQSTQAAEAKLIVHYQYENGQEARADQSAQPITFTKTITHDLVTNKDSEQWDKTSAAFNEVSSPKIKGYTPDQEMITGVTATPESGTQNRTVTYKANPQVITVNYIDDVTGKTLSTKTLNGVSDAKSGYKTKQAIGDYKAQHYVLVSDDTNGAELVFDHDDKVNQIYNVHLTHQQTPISDSKTINETIHYVYADGSKAADDVQRTPVTFTRTGQRDEVTNEDHWNNWTTGNDSFAAATSPTIAGYTPDLTTVAAVTVKPTDQDIVKTVTYNANDQKATLTFWDDTTGQVISGHDLTATGKTAGKIEFTDGRTTLSDLLNQHYVFVNVKNTTNGADQDVTSDQNATNPYGIIQFGNYDNADVIDQSFVIHLKHATESVTDTKKVNLTVRYQYADGLGELSGHQAAPDQRAKTITFNRTGTKDLVTNQTAYNPWNQEKATFDAITSPVLVGYTPDHAVIDDVTVTPGSSDQTRTVIYNADPQVINVHYIDDVTGKTLSTKTLKGVSNAKSGYVTGQTIRDYEAQHYVLVSDETNGAELVFDHDDAADQVYNVHLTHHLTPITGTKTINETIHYVYADGSKAAGDVQGTPVTFTRTGQRDDVTNENHWDDWKTENDSFAAVTSPTIAGYTPDRLTIAQLRVTPDSDDQEFTVTYTANPVVPNSNQTEQPVNGHHASSLKDDTIEDTASVTKTDQANQLPQTGNNQNSAALAGLASLGLAGMLGFLKKRKHD